MERHGRGVGIGTTSIERKSHTPVSRTIGIFADLHQLAKTRNEPAVTHTLMRQ